MRAAVDVVSYVLDAGPQGQGLYDTVSRLAVLPRGNHVVRNANRNPVDVDLRGGSADVEVSRAGRRGRVGVADSHHERPRPFAVELVDQQRAREECHLRHDQGGYPRSLPWPGAFDHNFRWWPRRRHPSDIGTVAGIADVGLGADSARNYSVRSCGP